MITLKTFKQNLKKKLYVEGKLKNQLVFFKLFYLMEIVRDKILILILIPVISESLIYKSAKFKL